MERVISSIQFIGANLFALLQPLYQNAVDNPVAAAAVFMALLGIPLFLRKSRSKKDSRLDQFEEEMKSFEGETPLIDLKEKFKKSKSIRKPAVTADNLANYDSENEEHDYDFDEDDVIAELEPLEEEMEPDNMVDLSSMISNDESLEDETYYFSEDQETTASESPMAVDHQAETNGWNPETDSKPLQETEWSQADLPGLPGFDSEEGYSDIEMANAEIDGLQGEIDESNRKTSFVMDSQAKNEESGQEVTIDTSFPSFESMEPQSLEESFQESGENEHTEIIFESADSSPQSKDSDSYVSEEDHEFLPQNGSHSESHAETVDNVVEVPFSSMVSAPETKVKEIPVSHNLPLRPVHKSMEMFTSDQHKISHNDYEELLESFILLKDQKR